MCFSTCDHVSICGSELVSSHYFVYFSLAFLFEMSKGGCVLDWYCVCVQVELRFFVIKKGETDDMAIFK